MNLQPLGEYVLLQPIEAEEMTAGGLYVPESAKERPTEGLVVALAADSGDDIALGDRVIYKRYAGEEIHVDGDDYRLVPVGDLLAKYVAADAIPE